MTPALSPAGLGHPLTGGPSFQIPVVLGTTTHSTEIEGHLDGTALFLGGQDGKGLSPLVESERVGEHPRQIDPALFHQVQVVGDPVHPDTVDLLDPEGVGSDPGDLLEVQR